MALTEIKTSGIADDAVTTDKLANAINTARDANTAKATNATHSGDVTGSGSLTIADNAVTLAKMAGGTDGQIITYDASGDPVAVGPGTDGQVLTSTGAGSPPAFEDIPAKAALTGSTNNTITTVTGANAIQGEANLTFDNSTLQVQGASGDTILKLHRTNAAGSNGNTFGNVIWSDNNANTVAQFRAVRDTAVDDAALVASTRPTGGSITERLRIDSSGHLIIKNAGVAATTGLIQLNHTDGRKNTIGTHYASNAYDSRIEFGLSDGSTGGGTNTVASISYAGISFGTDTASTNRLDDYEEGNWTPIIRGGSTAGTGTYNSRYGRYTKVGNMVTCWYQIDWSNITGASGYLAIGDLPYTVRTTNDWQQAGSVFLNNVDLSATCMTVVSHQWNGSQDMAVFYQTRDNAGWDGVSLDSSGGVIGTFTYPAS